MRVGEFLRYSNTDMMNIQDKTIYINVMATFFKTKISFIPDCVLCNVINIGLIEKLTLFGF